MAVGPGRIRNSGNRSLGPSSSSDGLVVQAVLVMALVTTIGVLVIASRVAGSRQSASSGSMSLAARQAAEYGYAEILAEMNRDPKSYLWVTNFSQWNSVSAQDLIDCGVALPPAAAPVSDPIPAATANQTLPNSPSLSYRLTNYQAPANINSLPAGAPACTNKFGNLVGGTAELTIVGTMNRGSGDTSTFTIKRTVSVRRAAPIFNNPVTATPSSRTYDSLDSRFPGFPATPGGTYQDITCEPNGGSSTVIRCTAGSVSANFRSATAPGSGNDYFPYSGGAPWGPCQQVGATTTVRCLIKTMTVTNNANMLVTTKRGTIDAPVEIYLSDNMTIDPGSRLSGNDDASDRKGWSRFRIFGVASGASCGSQTITMNLFTDTSAPAGQQKKPNLQNAFLWLRTGKLKNESSTAFETIPALVGSVCLFESSVAAPANLSTLSTRDFFDGLGGAYDFQGVFGSPNPIRFFYRGFGFYEQGLSS